jgi:hypothetical protein
MATLSRASLSAAASLIRSRTSRFRLKNMIARPIGHLGT